MEQRKDQSPLHWFAHARAGDKGNSVNISVIPYYAEAYEHLLAEVTADCVRTLLRHRAIGAVNRYEVPGLPALNFVIEDALEGVKKRIVVPLLPTKRSADSGMIVPPLPCTTSLVPSSRSSTCRPAV